MFKYSKYCACFRGLKVFFLILLHNSDVIRQNKEKSVTFLFWAWYNLSTTIKKKTSNRLEDYERTVQTPPHLVFSSESPNNNSGLSSEQGTCSGIPSRLVIEMLVTDAGQYEGVPQMEVVGTKIR